MFGFTDNPYSQATLPPSRVGANLISGRETEIRLLQRHIASNGAHAAVEGPIGAGKTSLINVAVYEMMSQGLEGENRELFIPAVNILQPIASVSEFESEVYRVIGQTLIKYKEYFKEAGLEEPNVIGWSDWLNSPRFRSWQGGFAPLSLGSGSEPNTSDGYTVSGFKADVKRELQRCLGEGHGAIVCVLDNLEVLESAGEARRVLDELRDRIFNIDGVRWVLCGSRGIVSRARTQRLHGAIRSALKIHPLDEASAVTAVQRRIHHFGGSKSVPPVTPAGFELIYRVLRSNLRDAMVYAQEFADWLAENYLDHQLPLPTALERDQLVNNWLIEKASQAHAEATGVQQRVWQFFDDFCGAGGRAGSSAFEEFDFNKQQQFTGSVSSLIDVNLMVREVDPENGAMTINSVTALGWLVHAYRTKGVPTPSAG